MSILVLDKNNSLLDALSKCNLCNVLFLFLATDVNCEYSKWKVFLDNRSSRSLLATWNLSLLSVAWCLYYYFYKIVINLILNRKYPDWLVLGSKLMKGRFKVLPNFVKSLFKRSQLRHAAAMGDFSKSFSGHSY